jgi:hypothetical protein
MVVLEVIDVFEGLDRGGQSVCRWDVLAER